MVTSLSRAGAQTGLTLIIVGTFLAFVLFFGGASRADVMSQPIVRVASILMIAFALIQIERHQWRQIKVPALFLLAVAAVIAFQLIPLPPSLWSALPGRTLYVAALASGGFEPIWRPLSMTPDLTLNALLAILPPLAAVLAMALISRETYVIFVPFLLIGVAISAMIGLLQISGGQFYFYNITNVGSPVGVFANRNHQAVFLACAFPLLACWAALPHRNEAYRRLRTWLALCMAAAIFPLLLITGSRAGLLLGGSAALGALVLTFGSGRFSWRQIPLLRLLPLIIGVVAVAAALFLSRDEAFRRLAAGENDETRVDVFPILVDMARDLFPAGSGFGSFDTMFRIYEPHERLYATYLNQAHNDYAQILIEGGALVLPLVAAFALWFVVRLLRLWLNRPTSPNQLLGRTASIVAVIILASSVVDYPLRTPLIAVLMAIACCWLLPPPSATAAKPL
jgi:O-antigen ligase